MKFIHFYFLALICLATSCSKKVNQETEVYSNDFETDNLSDISMGFIETYNNTKVLGRYNSGGFDLKLNNLPDHKLVQITFDLYIHDSWEGNGMNTFNGPDIWKMIIDDNLYINTTFSNAPCIGGNFCPPQSFPLNYPNSSQNPKWGSTAQNLPAACINEGAPTGTTKYIITKTIEHNRTSLLLQCRDQLVENSTTDNRCDESWSVDNIRVKVINL
jgi:hypothetical protein